jgi:hypothetical protein
MGWSMNLAIRFGTSDGATESMYVNDGRISTVVPCLELPPVIGCSGGVRFDAETLIGWTGC